MALSLKPNVNSYTIIFNPLILGVLGFVSKPILGLFGERCFVQTLISYNILIRKRVPYKGNQPSIFVP